MKLRRVGAQQASITTPVVAALNTGDNPDQSVRLYISMRRLLQCHVPITLKDPATFLLPMGFSEHTISNK